jgi:hypothetical protein
VLPLPDSGVAYLLLRRRYGGVRGSRTESAASPIQPDDGAAIVGAVKQEVIHGGVDVDLAQGMVSGRLTEMRWGLGVNVPVLLCPFVAVYLRCHPEQRDLVVAA